MLSRLPLLLSEPILSLPHSIVIVAEHAVFIFSLVIEDFFLLSLYLLRLEFVDHFLLLLSPLGIFKIIHIELVLEIVDVGEFLDVDRVESLKLSL